jgi:hypothetical protein
MIPLGRFGALFLGLALTLAWSSTATADRSKKSKQRGSRAASVNHGSSSGGSFRAPSHPSAPRSAAPSPRPTHRSSGERFGAPSGSYGAPAPQGSFGTPSVVGREHGVQRGGVQQIAPQRTAPDRRSVVLPRRGAVRGVPSELPRTALPAGTRVPATVMRGGTTFNQHVVAQGDRVVVRRTPEAAQGHGDGPPHHGQSHHHGDHDHYYRHHYWGHGYYYCYVHYWSYDPWFWGFYFAPFPTPWTYTWLWFGAPWYVSWGWYYQPYPYYAAPSYWVTDYVISSMLEDEYERAYAAGYAAGQQNAGTPISEPVKEQLRVQVDETAQAFQTEQAILLENALKNPEYLFIVDTPISAATADSGTCSLSGGDIIKPAGEADSDVPVASVAVVTAKTESCAAGTIVSVSFTDLQEMMNTFGERVDDGLNEMQKQGQAEQEGAAR